MENEEIKEKSSNSIQVEKSRSACTQN